jgi:hypothetical protein
MGKVDLFTRLFPQFEGTIGAMEYWYARTKPEGRTLENLRSYLYRNRKELPPTIEGLEGEYQELTSLEMLVQLLEDRGLSLKISPLLVDTLVRPRRIYFKKRPGYKFFLEHYQEHPFLEGLVRRSISDILRLMVKPAVPLHGNPMVWLFDPWEGKVYKFLRNDGETDIGVRWEQGRLISVSLHSICEEYDGPGHPFSPQCKKAREPALK